MPDETGNMVGEEKQFVVFSLGVFWWLLWIDYEYLKFAFPVIVWVILLYSTKDLWKSKSEVLNSKTRLVLFFGGIFFISVWLKDTRVSLKTYKLLLKSMH